MSNENTSHSDAKPCVLFSPLGSTDPARRISEGGRYFEGPLLHILRKYRPEKAVLYVTAEIARKFEIEVYKCLAAQVGAGQTQLEVDPQGKDVHDAHNFELFEQPFRASLDALHEQYPDHRLLVNVTSGTPQMEMQLCVLAAALPYPVTPVQVDTPARSGNKRFAASVFSWEEFKKDPVLGDDSTDELACPHGERCHEIANRNVRATMVRSSLGRLVDGFDYSAAITLCDEAKDLFPQELGTLLRAGKSRLAIDTDNAVDILKTDGLPNDSYFEIDNHDKELRAVDKELRAVYEYLLMMDTLLERENYGDFARSFSPAFFHIMRLLATKKIDEIDENKLNSLWGKNAHKYSHSIHLNRTRIEEQDPELLKHLDKKIKYGAFRDSDLSALLCLQHLEFYCPKDPALDLCRRLRGFESTVRNTAAHDIKPMSLDAIRNVVDRANAKDPKIKRPYPDEAMAGLKQLFESLYPHRLRWDGYQTINARIKELLKSEK